MSDIYIITDIKGEEVILNRAPPDWSHGNNNGLFIGGVVGEKSIHITIDMQKKYALGIGSEIQIVHPLERNTNPGDIVTFGMQALRYNNGKPQWSLVDFDSLESMVRVLEYGMKKYTVGEVSGKDNWKKPMDKKKILDSMMRHLVRLMADEELDSESKLPHIGHVLANCMMYSYHSKRSSGFYSYHSKNKN